MPPLALLLVVVAAVSHAAWNLASKRASATGLPFIYLGAVASTVLWAPVAVVDVLLSGVRWDALALGAAVSALIHVGYMWVLQRGYAAGDVSVVYPMARGTGPLLSVVLAIVLLGERPNALALAGTAVVVAGIVGIGLTTTASSSRSARMPGPGILWGLATGVLIAVYTLWDAHTVTALGVAPVPFMVGCTAGEVLVLAPILHRRRAEVAAVWRAHRSEAIVVGLLSPLSYVLVLVAMTIAPVSLVAPARELSVVLVSLAGWLLLKEPRPLPRMAGAVVVVVGVVLLGLS